MSLKAVLNTLADDPDLRALTVDESSRLKKILLEHYLIIQEFCEKHHFSVMLVGGSALGAVRHQGYIPWDDDMDIAMPREDYDQFAILLKQELGDRFILDAPNTEKKASNRFPKILIKGTKLVELGMDDHDENACMKIDLFIIENAPQNRVMQKLHGFLCTLIMFIAGQVDTYEDQSERFRTYMCKTEKGKRIYEKRKKIGRLFSFFPAYRWNNLVDRVCRYKRHTGMRGIPTGRKHYFGEILPEKAFLPVSQGSFEGFSVNLPGDPDAYLKNLFGDYMTIPKVEEREKHFIYDIKFPE